MKTTTLNMRIQVKRVDHHSITVYSRGREVRVAVFYAREKSYEDVRYKYLHCKATLAACVLIDDLDIATIYDYYEVRNTIRSMLELLHRHSATRFCIADVEVCIWKDDHSEDNNEACNRVNSFRNKR